jgi:hypothetical protein
MPLKATRGGTAVMKGIEVLKEMNAHRKRKVPASAPTSFVPNQWRPFFFSGKDGAVDRHGWELCLPSELRGHLRPSSANCRSIPVRIGRRAC